MARTPEPQELKLDLVLSPHLRELLRAMGEAAESRGQALYIVGGFVRDLLLQRSGLDLDLVLEGDAVSLAHVLAAKYGGRVTVHKRFGTAQWTLPESLGLSGHSSLDLISARSETYSRPGALPVVRPGRLIDDLRRRDFTVNTLALRVNGEHFGELIDELGGVEDLEKGAVRVLHPASYCDDPTRILRAVRYEQRYGFRIDAKDLGLIAEAKGLLSGLSGERLRHELDLILTEQNPAAMLSRLDKLGILVEIHSSLVWNDSLHAMFAKLNHPEPEFWKNVPNLARVPRQVALGYLLWLSGLDASTIQSLAARLDFSASLREALLASSALRETLPSLTGAKPGVITTRLDKVPPLVVCALLLHEADLNWPEAYLSRWRHVKPRTTGNTLKKMGLQPGPEFQRVLSRLRQAWLDEEIHSAEEEKMLVEKLL